MPKEDRVLFDVIELKNNEQYLRITCPVLTSSGGYDRGDFRKCLLVFSFLDGQDTNLVRGDKNQITNYFEHFLFWSTIFYCLVVIVLRLARVGKRLNAVLKISAPHRQFLKFIDVSLWHESGTCQSVN